MAKIIVIANGKGGTGKSTITVQFANYLTSIGKAVAVLDGHTERTGLYGSCERRGRLLCSC